MQQKKPKEKSIEEYFTKRCKELDIFVLKNTGMNGIPDRLLIKDGIVIFLELKRPGKRPDPLQKAIIKKLRWHGVIARHADTKAEIDKILELFEENDNMSDKAKRRKRLLANLMISAIKKWKES